jgi:hypothetical protein
LNAATDRRLTGIAHTFGAGSAAVSSFGYGYLPTLTTNDPARKLLEAQARGIEMYVAVGVSPRLAGQAIASHSIGAFIARLARSCPSAKQKYASAVRRGGAIFRSLLFATAPRYSREGGNFKCFTVPAYEDMKTAIGANGDSFGRR